MTSIQNEPKSIRYCCKNTNGTTAEGLVAPRMTGDQIKQPTISNHNTNNTFSLAIASVGTPSAKTINISEPGILIVLAELSYT